MTRLDRNPSARACDFLAAAAGWIGRSEASGHAARRRLLVALLLREALGLLLLLLLGRLLGFLPAIHALGHATTPGLRGLLERRRYIGAHADATVERPTRQVSSAITTAPMTRPSAQRRRTCGSGIQRCSRLAAHDTIRI